MKAGRAIVTAAMALVAAGCGTGDDPTTGTEPATGTPEASVPSENTSPPEGSPSPDQGGPSQDRDDATSTPEPTEPPPETAPPTRPPSERLTPTPAPTDAPPPATGEVPSEYMDGVIADAVKRSGVSRNGVTVTRAQAVTWRDGSLGCPEPGMMYTQALVDGYWVVLEAGSKSYDYRLNNRGSFRLCTKPTLTPPPDLRDHS